MVCDDYDLYVCRLTDNIDYQSDFYGPKQFIYDENGYQGTTALNTSGEHNILTLNISIKIPKGIYLYQNTIFTVFKFLAENLKQGKDSVLQYHQV